MFSSHLKISCTATEVQVLAIGPILPAAWTTSPSVVVILELPDLAASGSEMIIQKVKRTNT